MKKRVLITAGLPYANGDLHVGHIAGCYLPADIITRFLRMQGRKVLYICGSDDHGAAIVLSSDRLDKTPAEVASFYHRRQREDFEGLQIDFDIYGSTSESSHHKTFAQQFFKNIEREGLFIKQNSLQFYDETDEVFLPDRYVKGECSYCHAEDQTGDQCEKCGKILDSSTLKNPKNALNENSVEQKASMQWFLDMRGMVDHVENWYEHAVLRTQTRQYVKSLMEEGLVKRSMTRDLEWGIPVPLEDSDARGKVLYVWFDAPIAYISYTYELLLRRGYSKEEYLKWWASDDSEVYHFIGEDNTIFHCIIWIIILSLQKKYHLPKGVIVNHFLNIKDKGGEDKISKTKKNALSVREYLREGGDSDLLRYYLTEISPERSRTSFNYKNFILLCNANLSDTLGNFINRTLAFGFKFIGKKVPCTLENLQKKSEKELIDKMKTTFLEVTEELEKFSTKNSIQKIFEFTRHCNKYFHDKAPWKERKEDLELAKVTIFYSYRSIYFLGVVLAPFLPKKSKIILSIFGITEIPKWKQALQFPKNLEVLQYPEILFPKQ